jgi:23S rRNA pseudouridine1911/1915/1917 synthase
VRQTVEPGDAGARLDVYLAPALGSRARAARLIDAGAVRVGGRAVAKRYLVGAGDEIEVDVDVDEAASGATGEVPAPVDLEIAYADEHLLVVDKPAGLVVHPGRGHSEGTLAQALAGRAGGGEPGRAGIVHRLDRDTSGLLVVARTEEAHRALRAQLQRREITREYRALVEGRPPARTGTIDAPVGRDRRVRTRMSTDTDTPREARTHFELLEALPSTTLLAVRLETGRTHQIRVHFEAIGYPVAGDPEYGTAGLLGLQRQFLHAARLRFTHPITATTVDISSDLPSDLGAALDRARAGSRTISGT